MTEWSEADVNQQSSVFRSASVLALCMLVKATVLAGQEEAATEHDTGPETLQDG